jgi:hypothetical protein
VRLLLTMDLISLEECIFVDHEGLNDQITTTTQTDCRYNFREDVIEQDGPACIITRQRAAHCDAVHLIPRCKGDKVMFLVVGLCNLLLMYFSSTS